MPSNLKERDKRRNNKFYKKFSQKACSLPETEMI